MCIWIALQLLAWCFLCLVRLLQSFTQWKKQTREAQRERMCMEKARLHHNSKILSKALKAWNKHHYQYRKYKVHTLYYFYTNPHAVTCIVKNFNISQVMKRQGVLLLRLKMYQTYFEQWKIKVCWCYVSHAGHLKDFTHRSVYLSWGVVLS